MSTLTIELPEDIAEQMERIPETERGRFTVAALRKELSPAVTTGRTADAILEYLRPVAVTNPPPPDKKGWSDVEGYE